MPVLDDGPAPPPPALSASASVAVELAWATVYATRQKSDWHHPGLADAFGRAPEVADRIRGFWRPDEQISYGGGLEILVLAHHGNLLESTDAALLVGRLEELAATVPADRGALPLVCETDEDREAVFRRLRRLRRSPQLRSRFAALVGSLWDAVGPEWERTGRRGVQVAVAGRNRLIARGADWHEVTRNDCKPGGSQGPDGPDGDGGTGGHGPHGSHGGHSGHSGHGGFNELLDHAVAELPPAGRILVVPAHYAHQGLLVDLPGVVVVGVGTDTTGAQARARTEALARRLKAISDPTRLALLDALRSGPRTVTELATAFALAQPTVSNHVKVLRDAGLVADRRLDGRRSLQVRPDVVDALLADLRETLAESPTST